MTRPNLVLGLAAGYHDGDVRPFLESLRRTGFSGRCVLFVSPTTRGTERMAALGAQIVPFTRPDELAHVPYNALRYFLYRDFLQKADAAGEGPFSRILLTDVRDVVFQRDPFAFPWPAGVSATLEDGRMRIGGCPYMAHWTRGHLGADVLDELSERPISCSGTTVAGHAAMHAYLAAMTARLLPFVPAPRMAGYDQAVHNLLVHRGLLPGLAVHDNGAPILTLGYVEGEAALDAAGDVLTPSGGPALIVHQYDRKPELFARIRARYA
ncbi:hypothetical protein dsx2_1155 [Desulfovibrio sp. X2]|uniref:hypothetical protein n=1 Tax=Desulfovibrio sp. X2 TaxID=941449 RepID=UPI000358AC7F|nr:hypothetical protein [Desulfovibrio sp. X2]EPR37212.1 hypothetical protein dsx2_1155 [Desulfovibrio sp. X2]